jgi:hypothetical protein
LSKWYIKRVTKKKLSASHLFGQCAGLVDKKELHFCIKADISIRFFYAVILPVWAGRNWR